MSEQDEYEERQSSCESSDNEEVTSRDEIDDRMDDEMSEGMDKKMEKEMNEGLNEEVDEETDEETPAATALGRIRGSGKRVPLSTPIPDTLMDSWDRHCDDELEHIVKYAREWAPPYRTHEEIILSLKRRRSGWTDEDEKEVKSEWDKNPLRSARLAAKKKVKDGYIALWKACNACLGVTPDFLLSGHLGFQATGGVHDAQGRRIDDPLPTPTFCERALTLVSHTVFQGQVKTIQAIIAFAVAARTGDTREFPYSLEKACGSNFFRNFDEANKKNNTSEAVKTLPVLLEETFRMAGPNRGDVPPMMYLLRQIGRVSIASKDKTPFSIRPDEKLVYRATVQDLTAVLNAIDGNTFHGVPTNRPTSFCKELKAAQRSQKGGPSTKKWSELIEASGLCQGYLRAIEEQARQAEMQQLEDGGLGGLEDGHGDQLVATSSSSFDFDERADSPDLGGSATTTNDSRARAGKRAREASSETDGTQQPSHKRKRVTGREKLVEDSQGVLQDSGNSRDDMPASKGRGSGMIICQETSAPDNIQEDREPGDSGLVDNDMTDWGLEASDRSNIDGASLPDLAALRNAMNGNNEGDAPSKQPMSLPTRPVPSSDALSGQPAAPESSSSSPVLRSRYFAFYPSE